MFISKNDLRALQLAAGYEYGFDGEGLVKPAVSLADKIEGLERFLKVQGVTGRYGGIKYVKGDAKN